MKPAAFYTTLRLLQSYLLVAHGPRRGVTESREFGEGAPFPTIVYRPTKPNRRTLVLIHGVTGRATDDPSLVHLARSLAGLGYTCVTPPVTRLAQFHHDPADIDEIVQGIRYASELAESPVGILGFSYGSSFALSAAADPRVAEHCRAVLGFGAYFDLPEALEHQRQLLLRHPDPAQDDADLAYLRYTLLACQRDYVALPAEAWETIDPLLRCFTSRAPIEDKRAPLLKYASHINFVELMQHYQASNLPEALSPKSVLGLIRCPVGLLHDPGDRFVPAAHAERIREVLDRRPSAAKTLVLTTPMLSHVQVNPRRNLLDLPKLVDLLQLVLG